MGGKGTTRIEQPNRGSLAGAANWSGTEHERGVAAYVAVHVLAGEPLRALKVSEAVPLALWLQADTPVDDVVCELNGGGHAFLQVRRTLDWRPARSTGLRWVADQWQRLAAERRLDPQRDRVVAVSDRRSPAIDTLDEQLERRRTRRRGRDTDAQREAIEKLEGALAALSAANRRRVLQCAVVWQLQVMDRAAPAVQVCWQLLATRVTTEERAQAAWDRLTALCGEGARLRQGFDAEELRDVLREANVPLRADAPDSRGAARAAAVRHKRRLIDDGTALTFAGLGATIPPLSMDEADAEVLVVEHEPTAASGREHGHLLWWVLRRRGRVLLTGLPGAGKSTAMARVAAEYASRRGWPLPVMVRVDRVAELLRTRGVRDAIFDVATEDAEAADRAPLRAALEAAVDGGDAALLLDGLDEARDARHGALRALRRFLGEIPDDVEVLLATRDVAYADAHTLRLHDARLLPPREPLAPARGVLEALAGSRTGADREEWVERRYAWVESATSFDQTLKETPLLPVLLAQLAASRDDASLPAERAIIMRDAVEAVVARWEAAKPDGRGSIGALNGRRAHAALLFAFKHIGRGLARESLPTRSSILTPLGEELARMFTLSLADGEVAAAEAIAFWDAAGFFVSTGAAEQLIPRVRLFAEVADALLAVDAPAAEQRHWAQTAIADPDRREPLALASALSPSIVDSALAEAARLGDAGTLLRAYRLPGARTASPQARAALGSALAAVAASDDPRRGEAAIAAIRIDRDSADAMDPVVEGWPAPRQRVALRVLKVAAHGLSGPDAERSLEALFALDALEDDPPLASGALGSALAFFACEDLLAELLAHSAEVLLPARPELAEVAARHLNSRLGGEGLRETLIRVGRRDLVDAADAHHRKHLEEALSEGPDWGGIPDFYAADLKILRWIADLEGPASLERPQRRRLDDLAGLWASLHLPFARSLAPAQTVERRPDTVAEIVRTAARLCRVPLGVLTAQAAELLAESRQDEKAAHHMLAIRGERVAMDRWDALPAPGRSKMALIDALAIGTWLSAVAFDALLGAHLSSSELDRLERVATAAGAAANRTSASCLRAAKAPAADFDGVARRLLASDDPAVRSGLGWFVAVRGNHEGIFPQWLVDALLDDPDDGVRHDFLGHLMKGPPPPSVVDAVANADWAARPWMCTNCGEDNEAAARACSKCNIAPGAAAASAAAFLAANGREATSASPPESVGGRRREPAPTAARTP